MSNITEYGRIPTEQQLLTWLKEKPRTFGWTAFLAYDRFRANDLLFQEYIARHSSEQDAFERVNGEMVISAGRHWSYLNDVVLDAPRLSFERSTVNNSLATLTLRITGGSHMTVTQAENGVKKVERIDWYDPLQGPKLIVGMRLNDTDGSVSEDGRVKLDLSGGVDIRLTLGTSDNEQEEGGRFFQKIFDSWDPNKKVLVLNELGGIEGAQFLNPDQFRLRAIPAPGANVRGSGTFGDGAIAVFVSAVGTEVGLTPDDLTDMMYPIPQGKSSTILIQNYYLIKNIFGTKAWDIFEARLVFDNDNPLVAIKSGKMDTAYFEQISKHWAPYVPFRQLSFYTDLAFGDDGGSKADFDVDLAGGVIGIRWQGEHLDSHSRWSHILTSDEDTSTDIALAWDLKRLYRFEPNGEGSIGIAEVVDESITNLDLIVQEEIDPVLDGWWPGMLNTVYKEIRGKIVGRTGTVFNPTTEIDLFRLHGLLFRSNNVVNLRSAHFPCDFAAFGDLSPASTSFRLEPLEHLIGAGASITMKTMPPQTGVTWKVENVTGFKGDSGTVSAAGVYQAPAAKDIVERYTMVKITASTATASSSSLMRVVRSDVLLNPMVTTASGTSGKIQMAAGSVDGGALNWSIKSATGATITDVPPDEGIYDDDERFYLPGTGSSGKPFSVDEVTVTNPRSGATHTSYVLRVETGIAGKVYIAEADLPAKKVRLEFDNNMGPIAGTTWTVVAGGGSVDANGVFTADESSPHKFAIITAYYLVPQVAELTNYIILPIPLVDLSSPDTVH